MQSLGPTSHISSAHSHVRPLGSILDSSDQNISTITGSSTGQHWSILPSGNPEK